MLFKTVYGPELECIYEYLNMAGPADRAGLYKAFIPLVGGEMGPRANLDDALTFLASGGLIRKSEVGVYSATAGGLSFMPLLLNNLRAIQLGATAPAHPMDPWFLGLVENIFARPGRPLCYGLHQAANSLEVPEVLSEEKVNAWKRVLEFIGLGSRLASGFFCSYRPELVWEIISLWQEEEGPLQSLLEGHISKYLPWEGPGGDVSAPLAIPLRLLARWGYIGLEERQDLPSRAYLEGEKIKWARKGLGKKCFHASRKAV